MKEVLIILFISFSIFTWGQEKQTDIMGSWVLVKEKRPRVKNEPSIMAIPPSEERKIEDTPRQIQFTFFGINDLKSTDDGVVQHVKFEIREKALVVGNREYKIVKISKNKMILSYELIGEEIKWVFQKINWFYHEFNG